MKTQNKKQQEKFKFVIGKCFKCKKTILHSQIKTKKEYKKFEKTGLCNRCDSDE